MLGRRATPTHEAQADLHGLSAQPRDVDVQAFERAPTRAARFTDERDQEVHGGGITVAHPPRDLARALHAGLDRIVELLLDATGGTQQLFRTVLALAQQIASRTRPSRDRRQQVRAGDALFLLLRELLRDSFHEGEFGLEAGTGHHLCHLPEASKTANFSRVWPRGPSPARQRMKRAAPAR